MSGDRSKLPKWAHNEMRDLERQYLDAREELAGAIGQHPKSRTYVDPLGLRKEPVYFKDGDAMCIHLEGRHSVQLQLGNRGECMLRSSTGTLHIIPQAANSAEVRVE